MLSGETKLLYLSVVVEDVAVGGGESVTFGAWTWVYILSWFEDTPLSHETLSEANV